MTTHLPTPISPATPSLTMRTRLTLERLERRLTPSASILQFTPNNPFHIAIASSETRVIDVTAVGATLYFRTATSFSNDNGFGVSDPVLWRTDGTPAGTRSLGTTFAGGTSFTVFSPPSQRVALPNPVPFNGQAYFFKDNALWVGAGTAGGTVMVKAFASAPNSVPASNASDNHDPAAVGGFLYFDADDGVHGYELWRTDGTAAGTTMVADVNPGPGGSDSRDFAAAGGKLFFLADDGTNQRQLYVTDGTAAGTHPLLAGTLANPPSTFIGNLKAVGNTLYFTVAKGDPDLNNGVAQVWKSDGTDAGTVEVAQPFSGSIPFPALSIGGFVAVGDRVFFLAANNGNVFASSSQVFVTDGTAAGTTALTPPPTVGTAYGGLTAFGGALYFIHFTGQGGSQLMRTDGTVAGTVAVQGLPANPSGLTAVQLPGQKPMLYLFTQALTGGVGGLYKTDGTAAGTTLVRSLKNASGVVAAAAGNHVYFLITDQPHGTQLWVETQPSKAQVVAVGAGAGRAPEVKVYNAASGAPKFTILAYPANFRGGVRVAVGDVNGDGVDDIVTVAGPDGGPVVKVFDGRDGTPLKQFFAYDPKFTGGVFVAAADLDLDGFADIITGAGASGGPHVEAFSGKTGKVIRSFFAYAPTFTGGVTVAAGDVNGTQDIITGAGPGGAPVVKVFDGLTAAAVGQFTTFSANFGGGVTVAAADTNADGNADVIVGAGPGYSGGPAVWVVNGLNLGLLRVVLPYDPRFNGGVTVGAADVNGDGRASLITGPGPGGGPDVRVFGGSSAPLRFNAFDPGFLGGVFVA